MTLKGKKKNRRIQILISEPLNAELSQAAKKSGVTKSAFIRVALEREFIRDRELESEISARDLNPGQSQVV